jgi:hypothetical protein
MQLNSGTNLKTGMGISVSDNITDIMRAYDVNEQYISKHTNQNPSGESKHIMLLYKGGKLTEIYNEATHLIDFLISDIKIEGIMIVDLVSLRDLESGQ